MKVAGVLLLVREDAYQTHEKQTSTNAGLR
jgi:hypothetical protein